LANNPEENIGAFWYI